MRTFNEKVKQFVENNFEKIVKIFFIQEKMPDFRRFIPNQIFLFFSFFANSHRQHDSKTGKNLIRLDVFYPIKSDSLVYF